MNKKGFTLVEVLAVLIVLGIIATIAYPIVTSSIEHSREKAYEEQVSIIEREARRWATDHSEELPEIDSSDRIGVDVATLITGGYITKTKDGKLYNPKDSKKTMDGCVIIEYSSEYNQYTYNYDEHCNLSGVPENCWGLSKEKLSDFRSFHNLDGSEEWMTKEYNMLSYISAYESCPKEIDTLILPEEVNGEKVEGIRYHGFYNVDIQKLVIPDSVQVIDSNAFYNTYYVGVHHVTFPDNLLYIGSSSFKRSYLKNVEIPGSVKFVGNNAFESNSIENVTISNGVNKIGSAAFHQNNIKSITIPESVTSIGASAFSRNSIESISILNHTAKIGGGAFNSNQLPDNQAFIYARNSDGSIDTTTIISYGGAKRDNVEIPNGTIVIGDVAFFDNQIKNIIIPESVTSIGVNAFSSNNLRQIIIPNNVVKIGSSAFRMNDLTNIVIPESVTTIGDYAFEHNELTNIEIPTSVTQIGKQSFNSNQLPDNQAFIYARNSDGSIDTTTIISYGGAKRDNVEIPNGTITIGNNAFSSSGLKNLKIPNSVTIIGDEAFERNALTSITIPESVTTIGRSAFIYNDFPNASSITIEGDATRFDSNWTNIGFPRK